MTTANDITKTLFKLAEAKRLNFPKVSEEIDNAEVIRDAAQDYLDRQVADALDLLVNSLEDLDTLSSLGFAISESNLERLRNIAMEIADLLPDEDALSHVVTTYDDLSEALTTLQDHVESPRSFDTDEKQAHREDTATYLNEFANALDIIDVVNNPTQEAGQ